MKDTVSHEEEWFVDKKYSGLDLSHSAGVMLSFLSAGNNSDTSRFFKPVFPYKVLPIM